MTILPCSPSSTPQKSADVGAVFAELIRAGLQALIEAEATRDDRRRPLPALRRPQHPPQRPSLQDGVDHLRDIEVKIPKLRSGSFFPSLLERRRRIDKALHAVIMEAYVHGVSTRSVDDLVAAPRGGFRHLQVRGLPDLRGLDREIEAFRSRTLTHTQFPYVFADATFCKVRVGAHVVSQALVVATGVSIEGTREVLAPPSGTASPFEFWREFLASLKARGLAGWCIWSSPMPTPAQIRCRPAVLRIVLAALPGAFHAQSARRGLSQACPGGDRGGQDRLRPHDPDEVAAQWDTVADSLAASFPKVAAMMNEAKADVLAFTAFRGRTGRRSGRITRSNGSTRRSNAALTSWRSSPTRRRSCAWPPPWSSRPTTSGRSPAATSRDLHGRAPQSHRRQADSRENR